MRSRQQRVERLVCGEHCRFFKPWDQETKRCAAYRWLLHWPDASGHTLESLERLRGRRGTPAGHLDAVLVRTVCTRCGYYPNDCAFRNPEKSKSAEPCGGIAVLHELLERQELTPEELYESPWLPESDADDTAASAEML